MGDDTFWSESQEDVSSYRWIVTRFDGTDHHKMNMFRRFSCLQRSKKHHLDIMSDNESTSSVDYTDKDKHMYRLFEEQFKTRKNVTPKRASKAFTKSQELNKGDPKAKRAYLQRLSRIRLKAVKSYVRGIEKFNSHADRSEKIKICKETADEYFIKCERYPESYKVPEANSTMPSKKSKTKSKASKAEDSSVSSDSKSSSDSSSSSSSSGGTVEKTRKNLEGLEIATERGKKKAAEDAASRSKKPKPKKDKKKKKKKKNSRDESPESPKKPAAKV